MTTETEDTLFFFLSPLSVSDKIYFPSIENIAWECYTFF